MSTTDFLPFATAGGANVTPQAAYAGASYQTGGFIAGLAQSPQLNKVWRQSSFVAAAIANFIINQISVDVPDDGNLTNFVTNFTAAVGAVAAGFAPSSSIYCGVSTGAANAQILTPSPAIGSYVTGTILYIFQVGPGLTNTGPTTVNISGLGAVPLYKLGGGGITPLTGGECPAGSILTMRYNGTQMQLADVALGTVATKNLGFSVNDPGTGDLEVIPADSSIRRDSSGVRVTPQIAVIASNRAIAAADGLKTLIAAAARTMSMPASSGFWNGFAVALFARGGNITLNIDAGDAINGGSTGVGAVIPAGMLGYLDTDGAGNLSLEIVQAELGYPSIASAATTDIGTLPTELGLITGSATVTSFGTTIQPGQTKLLRAGGAVIISNNSAIVVQGGANFTCAPGDLLIVSCIGSNVCLVFIQRANGQPVSASADVAGSLIFGGTINWNLAAIQMATVVMTGNGTFAAPSNPSSRTYILKVAQDGTGGRTAAWNSVFKWPGATPPILSSAPNAYDIFFFWWDGANMNGLPNYGFG